MLEHWLTKLEEIECDACLVNTHYLSEKYIIFKESQEIKNEY